MSAGNEYSQLKQAYTRWASLDVNHGDKEAEQLTVAMALADYNATCVEWDDEIGHDELEFMFGEE